MDTVRHWLANRIPAAGVRAAAAPYVAGDSLLAGIDHADELWRARSVHTTLDMLGEQVRSPEQARHAAEVYQEAARLVAERPWVSLSVKPGHLGFHVDPSLCERLVRSLAQSCSTAATRLTIDMEDRDLTDGTLDLYRRLKPDHDILGMVLQTKLHRTADDLRSLAGLRARVRLCIGVYPVPKTAGYSRKEDAKKNLLRLLPRALETLDLVELATHDVRLIEQARELCERRNVGHRRVEFQMLMGVPREALQDDLVKAGHDVRLYVPFAEAWPDAVAYLRRRLAENPSLAWLVTKNLLRRA